MKAAIYCRVSEEARNKQSPTDDGNGIQNQESICQGGILHCNTAL